MDSPESYLCGVSITVWLIYIIIATAVSMDHLPTVQLHACGKAHMRFQEHIGLCIGYGSSFDLHAALAS